MTPNLFAFRKAHSFSLVGAITMILLSSLPAIAGTHITTNTCGIILSQPGEYTLQTDVGPCTDNFTTGIHITASDVKLHLNGHTITGAATAGNCSFFPGIQVANGVAKVTGVSVQGPGTISNFAFGLFTDNSSDSSVKNVTITGACPFQAFGIVIQRPIDAQPAVIGDWQIQGNVVREPGNTSEGILLQDVDGNTIVGNDVNDSLGLINSSNNTVVNNTASNNEGGIFVSSWLVFGGPHGLGSNNNQIHGNTTNNNGGFPGMDVSVESTGNNLSGNKSFGNQPDMEDDNPNCGSNSWQGNQFNTANVSCIH